MAIRQILKLGEDVLREKAKIVTEFDDRLRQLIDDMTETMYKFEGVGLAAPQVGILKRVCVVSIDGGVTLYELVNPVIVKEIGKQCGVEACLSVPNRSGYVQRPKKIIVEACDRNGKPIKIKAQDYLAVAFCHEIDHLNGVIFIDKIVEAPKE